MQKEIVMKYSSLVLLCIVFTYTTLTQSCPTCVARVEEKTPPFFTDEFYPESATPG